MVNDMKDRYFVFAPEGCGFETFETEQEAMDCMNYEKNLWEKDANNNGEWSSLADTAVMGKVTHKHELIMEDVNDNHGYILRLKNLDAEADKNEF